MKKNLLWILAALVFIIMSIYFNFIKHDMKMGTILFLAGFVFLPFAMAKRNRKNKEGGVRKVKPVKQNKKKK